MIDKKGAYDLNTYKSSVVQILYKSSKTRKKFRNNVRTVNLSTSTKSNREIIELMSVGCNLSKIAGEKMDPDIILMNLKLISSQLNDDISESDIVIRECRGFINMLLDKGIDKDIYNKLLATICIRIASLNKWKDMPFNDAVVEIVDKLTAPY